ncbi:MAG TPA: hypothetical protein VGJ20_04610 [Xanthobacteraceae bacterium]
MVDLKDLWIAAPKTGRGVAVIAGAVGIACPSCGIKLRVLQARLQIASALVFVVPLGLLMLLAYFDPFYKDEVKRRASFLVIFVIYILGFYLLTRMSPQLLRLRFLKDGEHVGFPLEVVARVHKEEAQLIRERLDRQPPDVGQPSWVCPKCHEENPGNFGECWNCLGLRSEPSPQ